MEHRPPPPRIAPPLTPPELAALRGVEEQTVRRLARSWALIEATRGVLAVSRARLDRRGAAGAAPMPPVERFGRVVDDNRRRSGAPSG